MENSNKDSQATLIIYKNEIVELNAGIDLLKKELAGKTDPEKKEIESKIKKMEQRLNDLDNAQKGVVAKQKELNEFKNTIISKVNDQIKEIKKFINDFSNYNDKGIEVLSTTEILKSMLETKEGGAIVISIQAKPSVWKLKCVNDKYSITQEDIKIESVSTRNCMQLLKAIVKSASFGLNSRVQNRLPPAPDHSALFCRTMNSKEC